MDVEIDEIPLLETSARLREGWGFGGSAMADSEEGAFSLLLLSLLLSVKEKRRYFEGMEERRRGERRREA